MTPIQGRWYLISSGSTGYFSNSDKISGTTFDGNNEHFLLCMCVTFFLFFFYFIYTHQQLWLFLEKMKVWYFAFEDLLAEKVPVGLHVPETRTGAGQDGGDSAQPSSCSGRRWQEGDAPRAESGQEPAQPNATARAQLWPESPAACDISFSLPVWGWDTEQLHL